MSEASQPQVDLSTLSDEQLAEHIRRLLAQLSEARAEVARRPDKPDRPYPR